MNSLRQFLATGSRMTIKNCSNVRLLRTSVINRDIFKIQDQDDFNKRVKENKNVVILDFYATWCGPCKMLTPRLETAVGALSKSGVDLAKVDVDELDTIAAEFKVESIPAVYAIKNGQIIDSFVGLKDEDQLNSFIHKALGK